MDREIPLSERNKRRKKQIIRLSIIIVVISILILIVSQFLSTSISMKAISIGNVDRGTIESTVSASGKVVPLIQEIIVSPINSRILEVYKNPGETINAGEPILKLELSSIETEYNQKLDEREKRKSKLVQLQVKQDNSISDLQMQQQIKEMQLKQYNTDLQSEKYLDSIGASTPDKVRKAELNYEEAKLQLEQLKLKIVNERKNIAAELQVEKLDLSIFEKTLGESARLLKDAHILSPQKATLTFINNLIGTQVAQGEQIAVVSDLTRFKIDAEIAGSHAEKMALGAKAIVEIGNKRLPGTVVNIIPAVDNGVMKFSVLLNDPSDPTLRSGVKANVYVSYGISDDVIRIPYGQFFNTGKGEYDLWVINGNKAEKRKVMLGENSFEYIEVIRGLESGEKVITSNMENYKSKESLNIENK